MPACNLQNNVNQFILRISKLNPIDCQKHKHDMGTNALITIHKGMITD